MASLHSPCAQPLEIRVKLSSAELAHLKCELHSEFGPLVVSLERAEELKEILALADKDIEDHGSEVARLQKHIMVQAETDKQVMIVQAEKQQLEIQRAQLGSLLSPMRKLSNELLLHTFQYACEENILQSYPWLSEVPTPTEFTFPVITYLPSMAISSVCSRWHALVLSSPSLWANLTVETHTARLDQVKTMVGFIDTVARYLERSGDYPLKVALDIDCTPGNNETEIPSLIFLKQHARRWKTFTYRGIYSTVDHKIPFGLHLPILTELDIYSLEQEQVSSDLDCLEHAPNLCALATRNMPIFTAPYHFELRHLKLDYNESQLAEVLHRCPSLSSLELGGYEIYESEKSPHYTWRNITSLAIEAQDDFYPYSYLETEAPWPTKAFLSFICRSSCMITTLTLRMVSLSDSDLIAALRVMPSLHHLQIDDGWGRLITSHLIFSLTQHQSSSISLVPKLRTLHLVSQADTRTFDDSAFVKMVESRWFRPGSDFSAMMFMMGKEYIRSVVLKLNRRKVDAEVYKLLRILDAEGLRVVVVGMNGIQV